MLLTTRSPIEIVPEVMFSSPASIRNKVDLPQPDGPTSTTKAPSSIGIDTPCRTSKPPNDFRTSRICTDDIKKPPEYALKPAENAASPSFDRGHTTLFRCCPWIKVVGVRLGGCAVAKPAMTCKHRPPTQRLRTKIRRVRCGRTYEQVANRRHQAQTSFQRVV